MGDSQRRDVTGLRESVGQTGDLQPSTRIMAVNLRISTPRDVDYAGTDANVFFVVNGHSYLLDKPRHDDFEKGSTDTYRIPLAKSLEEFRRATLEIGHDNSGRNAGWYCGVVWIYIVTSQPSGERLYGRWTDIGWLAADENQGETYAVLQYGEAMDRAERIPAGEVPAAPAQ